MGYILYTYILVIFTLNRCSSIVHGRPFERKQLFHQYSQFLSTLHKEQEKNHHHHNHNPVNEDGYPSYTTDDILRAIDKLHDPSNLFSTLSSTVVPTTSLAYHQQQTRKNMLDNPSNYNISIWPLPQEIINGSDIQIVDPNTFEFVYVPSVSESVTSSTTTTSEAVDILQSAFLRYYAVIFGSSTTSSNRSRNTETNNKTIKNSFSSSGVPIPSLTSLSVTLLTLNDTLQMGIDESYTLTIEGTVTYGNLTCTTVYGCLHGLETFSQLIIRNISLTNIQIINDYVIGGIPLIIHDYPRFPHRGLLVDTSRHYLPIPLLEQIIDTLAYDKANVLHWHLTDVQSFPYYSTIQPSYADGAWVPGYTIYTVPDMKNLVTYAKYRGIRIIIELDNPAHSLSWSAGNPDIVLPCPSNSYSSVLDPTNETTYQVITNFIGELVSIFPDMIFHIGGDEVIIDNVTSCYNTSIVNAWMVTQNISVGDYKAVTRYHLSRIQDIVVHTYGKYLAGWEEILDHYGPGTYNPTPYPTFFNLNSTIIYLWFCPCWEWYNMSYVTQIGFHGIKSDDYYFMGGGTWDVMYQTDPLSDYQCNPGSISNCSCPYTNDYGCFNITDPVQQQRVLGGEGSMWSEDVDETNIVSIVWPRMSAVSERLWSNRLINDPIAAAPRITDHRCRLVQRGIPAAPINPGYCNGSRR